MNWRHSFTLDADGDVYMCMKYGHLVYDVLNQKKVYFTQVCAGYAVCLFAEFG